MRLLMGVITVVSMVVGCQGNRHAVVKGTGGDQQPAAEQEQGGAGGVPVGTHYQSIANSNITVMSDGSETDSDSKSSGELETANTRWEIGYSTDKLLYVRVTIAKNIACDSFTFADIIVERMAASDGPTATQLSMQYVIDRSNGPPFKIEGIVQLGKDKNTGLLVTGVKESALLDTGKNLMMKMIKDVAVGELVSESDADAELKALFDKCDT